jgi:AcrR family transcriptional regulator
MTAPDRFAPAPGRGQYDRRQSRDQRLAEQKERLVAATARAFAIHASPSVAHVIEIAAVGRGTFYEYFDDVENARAAAVSAIKRSVEHALRAAEARSRTPVERFRALAAEWLSLAETEPAGTLVALRVDTNTAQTLSPIGAAFEAALTRSQSAMADSGVSRVAADPQRTLAVAAAAEAFARTVAIHSLPTERPTAKAFDRGTVERALVDVAVRLLR